MKKTTGENASPSITLKIGKKLTIHNLVKYHQENSHCLNLNLLQIDASEVNEIDTAALQLVAYYILTIKQHQGSIRWNPHPSKHFLEQVTLSGMDHVLVMEGD